jgi:glycosyltransferase involved in cell wall biosynthesis
MKIAFLTTDSREHFGDYTNPVPYFGTAPQALLSGFACMAEGHEMRNGKCKMGKAEKRGLKAETGNLRKDSPEHSTLDNRRSTPLEIHVISCTQRPMQSPEKLADHIWFHSLHVPKWGWLKTGYLGCILAVRKKLGEIQPDLVHGQGTERDCAMSAVFSGFPNVLTIHGNMLAIGNLLGARVGSFYWIAAKLEKLALAQTDGVFCNSAYTENLVRQGARKTWRIPNALAEEYFTALTPKPSAACPILVNVGNVSQWKRQLEILEAAESLHIEGNKFRLLFFGACKDKDRYGGEFLRGLRKAEDAGYARYLGHRPVNEIVAALDSAQGMVHFPSEEAFGLAPAEGLARNLKLFGSRVGGIIDITSGVEATELLDVNDWAGLRAAITKWLKNGAPQPSSAAQEMKARYHPITIAQRHLDIYREVLAENLTKRTHAVRHTVIAAAFACLTLYFLSIHL